MRNLMNITSAAIMASILTTGALAQDAGTGFTIKIFEDPRTKRDLTVAPQVQNPAALDLRYASEKPVPLLSVQAWRQGSETEFRAWSNYSMFAQRAEIVVEKDGREIVVLPIRLGASARTVQALPEGASYRLRVYDARGRSDVTRAKSLAAARAGAPARGELLYHAVDNDLERQGIRKSGRAVTADGFGVEPGQFVEFEGYTVPVLSTGRFEDTQIIPAGDRVLDLAVRNRDGQILTRYTQPLSVADEDFFYVGIADLTVGQNETSGPIEQITGDDSGRFDDEIYVNGRLAFYLRGKVRGDWLITAAADTREGPVEDLFDNFLKSDARSFIRRLDRNKYYPVYGDNSTARLGAPTDGKLYVRLERDGREVLWGNFKTRAPNTHFSNASRSLYGARVRTESAANVGGAPRIRTEVYAAEPGTVQAQDEFRGTGGSLYFLRNRDILGGSARVWLETRDRTTGALLTRNELTEFEDFDLNAIQGRISLETPLGSTGGADGLLNGASTGGNLQYLVVRYEHSPGIGADDEAIVGGSADIAVSERLTLGINAIDQSDGPNDQTVLGAKLSYKLAERSEVSIEAARSKNSGGPVFTSIDGGFTFVRRPAGASRSANAGRLATSLDFTDFGMDRGHLKAFIQNREVGFSGPGEQTTEAVRQYGLDLSLPFGAFTDFRFLLEGKDADSQSRDVSELNITHQISAATKIGVGIAYDDLRTRNVNASSALSATGRRMDAIVRVDHTPREGLSYYGYVQGTLERDGTRARNNRVGLGADVGVSDRLNVGGEISDGDGGLGAIARATWQMDDKTQTYLSYSLEPDSADNRYRGQIGKFTIGGRRVMSDYVSVLVEQSYHHGDGPVGTVTSLGLDLSPENEWNYAIRTEFGDISDPLSGDLERRAVSLSAGYRTDTSDFSGTLEYRLDKGANSIETWGLRTRYSYQVHPDWRWLMRLEGATSDSNNALIDDTEFLEFTTGYAYRPVENDKLNALFRYTFLYDSDSSGQVGAGGEAVDFAQRSHVFSVDGNYEVNNTFSFGTKLGARLGDVRLPGAGWVSSDAWLAILRADVRLRPKWDLVGEYRYLGTPDVDASRSGFLVAAYRRVNENFRVGIGYNATDFSDDLTDQSYTSKGLFLNVIGKF